MTSGGRTSASPLPPGRLMRLIGRESELPAIGDLVGKSRLVTLTGPGGIGKTRLASELVARRRADSAEVLSWVDLSTVGPGPDVVGAFAAGVRVTRPSHATIDGLVDLIGDTAQVLVVDNCEHLVDDAVEIIEQLLDRCPRLSVLATSRLPLELAGEVTWRLSPLSIPGPDSVHTIGELAEFGATALFVERSVQSLPNHTFGADDVSMIVAICRMLDGNPLGLQLAAARMRTIGLAGLRDTLAGSLGVLDGGSRRLPARQRSVTVSLHWSYELLDAETQRLLRALSILEGEFDLDTASGLSGSPRHGVDEAGPVNSLARLVDVGFVDFDVSRHRYRLLFTVRQFAGDLLREMGEHPAAAAAHARYWVRRAASSMAWGEHYSPEQPVLHASDLRNALRWAMENDAELATTAIAKFGAALVELISFSQLHEWCAWLVGLQPRPVGWPEAVAAIAPFSSLAANPALVAAVDEASRRAEEEGNPEVSRLLLLPRFYEASGRGDLEGVTHYLDGAHRAGHSYAVMALSTHAALASAVMGNHAESRGFATIARGAALAGGLDYRLTAASIADRLVLHQRGELDAAARWQRTNGAGTPAVVAVDLVTLGGLALDRIDHTLMKEVLFGMRRLGSVDISFRTRLEWARACLARDWEGARSALDGIRELAPFFGIFGLDVLLAGAWTSAVLGDWSDVAALLQVLDAVVAPMREPTLLVRASSLVVRARLALHESSPVEADRLVHEALQLASAQGYGLVQVDALETLAVVALHRGNQLLAARLLGASAARREFIGYRNRLASAATDEHLDMVDPSMFDQARSLTISEALGLARRARGHRRRPKAGPDSLTPTERSVAELAAAGLSTREIAGRLLMSPATVKTHLTHIFGKLSVTNRVQLGAKLS